MHRQHQKLIWKVHGSLSLPPKSPCSWEPGGPVSPWYVVTGWWYALLVAYNDTSSVLLLHESVHLLWQPLVTALYWGPCPGQICGLLIWLWMTDNVFGLHLLASHPTKVEPFEWISKSSLQKHRNYFVCVPFATQLCLPKLWSIDPKMDHPSIQKMDWSIHGPPKEGGPLFLDRLRVFHYLWWSSSMVP
jgi:hypothetical protein